MFKLFIRSAIFLFLGGSILASLIPGSVPCLYAAELNLSASVNTNSITLDDRLVLQVNVSGGGANLPKPAIPAMPAFTAYSAGTSQNMSFVNGSFSSSLSYQYVLVPKTAGRFTIPPITLHHEGKTYQTQPISVEVTAAAAAPRAAPVPQDSSASAQNTTGRDAFITASIDKATAYVNEQITYTFRFYTRLRLTSNPQLSLPDFSGFWTDETPPRNFTASVHGQQYAVTEVKMLIFPARPGRFTLGQATLQCNVEDFHSSDPFSDDFFRSFFAGGKTHVLRANALSINVLPLPEEGKPRDFGGAVGQFRVTAEMDRTTAKTDEPVTLNITVTGSGNIKTLTTPALPDWPDFRKYETVSSLTINKDGETLKGSKTFKTVIVPQLPGKKTVMPIAFSYFDPAQRRYVTATTPALALTVTPGLRSAGQPPVPATSGGITVVNQDIRYLKSPASWTTYAGPLYRRGWFVSLNVVPLLLGGLAFVYRWRQDRLNSDVAYARRKKASAAARKYLKNARRLLDGGTPADFHAAIARALLEYIAHKTNVSADGLTFAAISGMLQQRNVPEETIAEVKQVLDECDLVRFAPASVTPGAMQQTFEQAQELIGRLEKGLQ